MSFTQPFSFVQMKASTTMLHKCTAALILLLCSLSVGQAFLLTKRSADVAQWSEADCSAQMADLCADFMRAAMCTSVNHCIYFYWSNQKPPLDFSESCESCQELVQSARNELNYSSEYEVQQSVWAAVTRMCQLQFLMDEETNRKCEEGAAALVPGLIALLKSQLDSRIVCLLLSECSANASEESSSDERMESVSSSEEEATSFGDVIGLGDVAATGDICGDCETFVADAVNSLRQQGKTAFVGRALNVCRMSKLRNICVKIVRKDVGKVYDWLVSAPAEQICNDGGFCGTGVINSFLNDLSEEDVEDVTDLSVDVEPCKSNDNAGSGEMCPLCEFAMQQIERLLSDKTTEKEIKQYIEEVCNILPATIKELCGIFVDQYADQIFAIIAMELNTTNVCAMIGVCPTIDEAFGDSFCQLCHYEMRLVHLLLNMDHVKELVALEAEDLCDVLPAVWSPTCREFMDRYADSVLDQLKELDVTVVCDDVSICGRRQPMPLSTALDIETKALNLAKVNKCEACVVTFRTIKRYAVIGTKALNVVCYLIPEYNEVCTMLVNEFEPFLTRIIISHLNPETVCERIHLCSEPADSPIFYPYFDSSIDDVIDEPIDDLFADSI